jgi:hypothetical protein
MRVSYGKKLKLMEAKAADEHPAKNHDDKTGEAAPPEA